MDKNNFELTLFSLPPHGEWVSKDNGLTFVFPRSGAARCVSGAFSGEIEAGDVLVLNGEGSKLCGVGSDVVAFGCFSLRVEHLFRLFDVHEICLLQGGTAEFKSPKLYPASASLAEECHRLLGDSLAAAPARLELENCTRLVRTAAAMLSLEFKNTRRQQFSCGLIDAGDHDTRVFERMSGEEFLTLSDEELTEKVQLDRGSLNRFFYQHFGFSVNGLKLEMRLLKAVSLLCGRQPKIREVAKASGFNHLGLFEACFMKRFGAKPGDWRRLRAGRAIPPQLCPLIR